MSLKEIKNNGENKKNISRMIKGYRDMARINIELAEKSMNADNEALTKYELFLSESEDCDCKKGRHLLR